MIDTFGVAVSIIGFRMKPFCSRSLKSLYSRSHIAGTVHNSYIKIDGVILKNIITAFKEKIWEFTGTDI